jgi:hypothetical protein
MKTLVIYLAVTFLSSSVTYSQKENSDPKNSLGLMFYNPVNLTGAGKFYNDDRLLYGSENRTSYKYAFGLDFKQYINENIFLKMWGGVSRRAISENFYDKYDYLNGQQYVNQSSIQNIDYEQTSFNLNAGAGYSKSFGNFGLNSGFELSYLHTGKGEETYNRRIQEDTNGILLNSSSTSGTINIGSGNSYGIGFFLGAEYNIFKQLSIGAEFHQFLYYSIFDNSTQSEYIYAYIYPGISPFTSSEIEEYKEDFKQFSFSNIFPVIELRYKF